MGTGKDSGSITGGGSIMTVSESGNLVYRIAIVPGALQRTQTDSGYIYKSHKWSVGAVISDIFRKIISETGYKNVDSNLYKYQLYTNGDNPDDPRFYVSVNWTFIKQAYTVTSPYQKAKLYIE